MEIKADLNPALDLLNQIEANQTLNPILDPLTKVFDQANREQIESEGQRGGEIYEPLRPATVKERRRLGYGPEHPILQREGDLLEAASHGQPASQDGGKTATISYQDEEGLLPIHQEGNDNLASRPPVEPTDEDLDAAAELMADQLIRGL